MGLSFDTNYSSEKAKKDAIDSDRVNSFAEAAKASSLPKAISERHVACVFILDISGSMTRNNAILKLNEGMQKFKEYMQNDSKIADVVDASIITMGSKVTVEQDFAPVSELNIKTLNAYGQTPLGEALIKALELVEKRKQVYKTTGTPYFRPWIFCITDGCPTDDWHDAAKRLKQAEDDNKVLARCVCVENDPNFSKDAIKQIFKPNRILKLENLDFSGLFEFVSNSLAAVSQSKPGDNNISVNVPNTVMQLEI